MKTHLDLFSGIGGFALAAKWAGYETVGFCEVDKFCKNILEKHFPDVPIHCDIKLLTSEAVNDSVSICQELKAINIQMQKACTSLDSQSECSQNFTESQDRQCTKYSLVETLYSELISERAKRITSLEEQGQVIIPKIYLNTLYERVLSFAKLNAKNADQSLFLKTEEAEYMRTTATITSLLKLCGFVRNVIMNGIDTIGQYKKRKEVLSEPATRIDLLTGGFP